MDLLVHLPLAQRDNDVSDEEKLKASKNAFILWRADSENSVEIVSIRLGVFGEKERVFIFPAGMLFKLAFRAIKQRADIDYFAWESHAANEAARSQMPHHINIDVDNPLSEEYKVAAIEQLVSMLLGLEKSFDKLTIENFFGDISCRPISKQLYPTDVKSALEKVERDGYGEEKRIDCLTDALYFTLCHFPLTEKNLLRQCTECKMLYFPSKKSQKYCWFRSPVLEDMPCKEAVRIIRRDEWDAERNYNRKIAVLIKTYDMRSDESSEKFERAKVEIEEKFATHPYRYKELSAWATRYKQANKLKAGRKKGK
jgi:hypothetical protein